MEKISTGGKGYRKPFIMGGVVLGVLLSAYYLYLNYNGMSIWGRAATPDPVWTRFVNIALILFACIFQASLLGKGVDRLMDRKGK